MSLTNNGLRDWLIQRVTAIVLAGYFSFLLVMACLQAPLEYVAWAQLFHSPAMRIFTVLALLALSAHAWIGLWTVLTDYIKGTALRLFLETVILLMLLSCLIWGITIIWGV